MSLLNLCVREIFCQPVDDGRWMRRGVAEEGDIPEPAVTRAQVKGTGGLSYNNHSTGEKNEKMSKKSFSIKINWTLSTNCRKAVMREQLSSYVLTSTHSCYL